ncbi:MAG: glycosyltransferase family 9 protein [Gemmatimonadales bacterium]
MPAAPLRILLVRFSAIGDVLLTTPLIRALRSRYPWAYLAAATKRPLAPLLTHNPHLDAVLALEPSEDLRDLADRIRKTRFTHLLDLHGNLRTAALRLMVPGQWRGYPHFRAARRRLVRRKEDRYPAGTPPVAERYFQAAAGLDIVPDGGPPEFGLDAREIAWARTWLGIRHLGMRRRLVVVAPGATHATKRWPIEAWKALVADLTARDRDVVVLGGPEDRDLAQAISAVGGERAASAAGEASLQGTGGLLSASTVAAAGDTGVMHMATGVGIPVVALFGPTVRHFGFTPYRARAIILERELDCRPCSYHGGPDCPLGHHRCLRDILPTEVAAALESLGG